MKRLFIAILCVLPMVAAAQNQTLISQNDSIPSIVERIIEQREGGYKIRKIKSNINLEFYTTANAYFTGGKFDEMSFKMNRVRLEFVGKLNENLSYHFRQSFSSYNNVNTVENLPSSIEYANLKWRFNDKFDLVVGKQFLAVAGYEGYVNGLLVREFSEFNNNFAIFQTGVKAAAYLTPDQHLYFQVVNQKTGLEDYGLPVGVEPSKFPLLASACWMGWFADGTINLQYSASAGQLAKGKNVLNTFCYTGGFSVTALKGGANKVVSVDCSKKAIAACEKNIALNGFDIKENPSVAEDAKLFLQNMKKGEFDLIILDPPAFAKHRDSLRNALIGYRRLNAKAIEKIQPEYAVFSHAWELGHKVNKYRWTIDDMLNISCRISNFPQDRRLLPCWGEKILYTKTVTE